MNISELKVGNWYHVPNVHDKSLLLVHKDDDWADFEGSEIEAICVSKEDVKGSTLSDIKPVHVSVSQCEDDVLLMWYFSGFLYIGQRSSKDVAFVIVRVKAEPSDLMAMMRKIVE